MPLLEEDEEFLNSKGYSWELLPNEKAGQCLVVHGFAVNADLYDRTTIELMVCIPATYNNAALDNFYVDPHLRLKSGEYPNAAAHMESHADKTWQRFSRHFHGRWRAGIDTLRSIWPHITGELQGKS